jgi:hypothetical protein
MPRWAQAREANLEAFERFRQETSSSREIGTKISTKRMNEFLLQQSAAEASGGCRQTTTLLAAAGKPRISKPRNGGQSAKRDRRRSGGLEEDP